MTRVAATAAAPRKRRGPAKQTTTSADAANPALVAAAEVVTRYIPTEIVGAYVAVATLMVTPGGSRTGQWTVFYIFLAMTPVTVWLFTASRARAASKPLPLRPALWPVFELVVASVSFVLWGFTLPATPFEDFSWYRPVQG